MDELQSHKGPSETAVFLLGFLIHNSFNPTRVRLKPGRSHGASDPPSGFNPTRVRLKLSRFSIPCLSIWCCFNPTRVRLKPDDGDGDASSQTSLQSHKGPSETRPPPRPPAPRTWLQSHKGPSETRTGCRRIRHSRFNPTRVRLKRGAIRCRRPPACRFNPTRVRLKLVEAGAWWWVVPASIPQGSV